VREANGLAMSSRNNRLSIELRNEAQLIYNVLKMSKEKFLTHSISEIKTLIGNMFDQSPAFVLEYFEIADESTLKIADEKQKNTTYRAFIAVKVDGIRLIDNLSLN
jgi:pantoate--beta-alanine ligase